MMVKTRIGIPSIDERFGGVFRGAPLLCVGPSGSGKTIFGLQFALQGIQDGERALILSTWRTVELVAFAASLELPLADAMDGGKVTLVEYTSLLEGQDALPAGQPAPSLSTEAFVQIRRIIETQRIQRLVIDPVLPWVTVPSKTGLRAHVTAFTQALGETGATVLLTLPRPASPLALELADCLRDLTPVTLELDGGNHSRTLTVKRYLGEFRLPAPLSTAIQPGVGFVVKPQLPRPSADA